MRTGGLKTLGFLNKAVMQTSPAIISDRVYDPSLDPVPTTGMGPAMDEHRYDDKGRGKEETRTVKKKKELSLIP